jgi:hypothetical protein
MSDDLRVIGHRLGAVERGLREEREERRENEGTIFKKLDEVNGHLTDIWRTLLLALIPLAVTLLVFALGK